MPVKRAPLVPWSELGIEIFEAVAQRKYLIGRFAKQLDSAADQRHGDLVGRVGMAAIRLPVPLSDRGNARRSHQRRILQLVALHVEGADRAEMAFSGAEREQRAIPAKTGAKHPDEPIDCIPVEIPEASDIFGRHPSNEEADVTEVAADRRLS
jgi:hypothetical protein